MKILRTALAGAVALSVSGPLAAAVPTAARDLAANCANCHGTNGRSPSDMPKLAGVEKARIVQLMKEFRDGKRPATIMHQLSKGYTDQQIELLAEFFSAQKP